MMKEKLRGPFHKMKLGFTIKNDEYFGYDFILILYFKFNYSSMIFKIKIKSSRKSSPMFTDFKTILLIGLAPSLNWKTNMKIL